jgi:hypothetical protein
MLPSMLAALEPKPPPRLRVRRGSVIGSDWISS